MGTPRVTPAALLSELRAAGATLRVVGGRLEAKALPPALAPLARVWAAELRRLLEQPVNNQGTPGRQPPDVDPAPPSGYPSPPVLAPDLALESTAGPELPAHLADTPEAWAAFLDSAPWIGLSERARILADAAF